MWRYDLIYENVGDNGIWHGRWVYVVRLLIRAVEPNLMGWFGYVIESINLYI